MSRSTEDEALAWNFFVRHYADDARQARDYKTNWETPDGNMNMGLDPPPGSTIKGALYPRAGTLGGCTAHNALVAVYPHRSDFDILATLTGDDSWSADDMRRYFERMERNRHLLVGPLRQAPGHGHQCWPGTQLAAVNLPIQEPQLLSLYTGARWRWGTSCSAYST